MSNIAKISQKCKTYCLLALSAVLGLGSGTLYQHCQDKSSVEDVTVEETTERTADEESNAPLIFKADSSLSTRPEGSKSSSSSSSSGAVPYNYLHELLLKTGLGLSVNEDFFVLTESALKTVGKQVALDDKVIKFYAQTNRYRHLSYTIDAALDSVMKVESNGYFDPNNPCNKKGYCGLMQIGESAFVEVLRLSLGSEDVSRRFIENHPEIKPYFELLDRESDGLIGLIQRSQQEITEVKNQTNDAISQLKQRINEKVWSKNDLEYLQLQRKLKEEIRYNNSLTAFRRYLNSAVQINGMKRFNEANEIYQQMRGYEGDFIFDYGLFLQLSFVDKKNPDKTNDNKNNKSNDQLDYTQELSLQNISDRFNHLWEKVKVNPKLNVTVAGIYWLYLKDVFKQNRSRNPEIYESLDPFVVQLEYYNKGSSYVDKYLNRNGQLPGTGNYPDKVKKALSLFQNVNEQFYGSEILECNHLNRNNYCKNIPPPAINEYLGRKQKQ